MHTGYNHSFVLKIVLLNHVLDILKVHRVLELSITVKHYISAAS